ncbi:MAG: hypothetical protein P4L53_17765 [Candidatus Obscuribacterales bacterium]|nr:hypothetical protein [Candidatus Obscuribacterales bacterium]
MVSNHGKQTDAKVQALATEFSVGHPSRDFITKARKIGAFDYSVTPDPAPVKKAVNPEDVLPFDPDWNADSLEPGGEKAYIQKLDAMESKFKDLSDGSASILLMVIPPFGREGCRIQFKQGKVTTVRVFTLD